MANEVTIRLRDGDMAVLAAPRAEKAAFRMSPQVMLAAAAGAVIGAIVALLVTLLSTRILPKSGLSGPSSAR